MRIGWQELLIILGLVAVLFGAAALPRLGRWLGAEARKRLRFLMWVCTGSPGAERRFGEECAREFEEEYPGEVAAERQELVAAVGSRLARAVKPPPAFSFRAIAAPEANAFALPGGFVFVSESLLELCQGNQDEIAFVLAHEMGHVLREHTRDRLMADALLKLVTARSVGAADILARLVRQGYSQQQELEADREAVRLARSAGFDPSGGVRALRSLKAVSKTTPELAQYLSSHPELSERLRGLESAIGAA